MLNIADRPFSVFYAAPATSSLISRILCSMAALAPSTLGIAMRPEQPIVADATDHNTLNTLFNRGSDTTDAVALRETTVIGWLEKASPCACRRRCDDG